ncbi:MAG: helix-turn-helix domain-containing protein [Actinomycetota bacterium]|nr:helix-turn-helix domain-containing protein [Actinomycetota bacterium]
MDLDANPTILPDVLTVEEAAAILRIGRSAAYALARRYRATGGREGLPVIELGRHLRVPRSGLRRLLNGVREAEDEERSVPDVRVG